MINNNNNIINKNNNNNNNNNNFTKLILQKQHRKQDSPRGYKVSISVYDAVAFDALRDAARKAGCDISSVVYNLINMAVAGIATENARLDDYAAERKAPTLNDSDDAWFEYITSFEDEIEYKEKIDAKVNTILKICNQHYRDMRKGERVY